MFTLNSSDFNLHELIERQGVITHFQPIVSIRRGQIIGVEALSRGVWDNALIPPGRLFHQAASAGLSLELDHLCTQSALEAFAALHSEDPDLVLLLNVDTATLERDGAVAQALVESVQQVGLEPRNVGLEVLETKFSSSNRLKSLITDFRNSEFLILLDDVGVGHSNLDRIAFLQPDIIKVDRSLLHNVHQDYFKQEILGALVNLSERIGGWVIAEGVETQEEAICALNLRADLLQGFYFARPHPVETLTELRYDLERVQQTAVKFKSFTLNQTRIEQTQQAERLTIVQEIAAHLQTTTTEEIEARLGKVIAHHPRIESACILDAAGLQITSTLQNPRHDQKQKTLIFKPPSQGTSHAFKEYFYLLVGGTSDPYSTEPYVPLPSGDLCITVSTRFESADQDSLILCLHLIVERHDTNRSEASPKLLHRPRQFSRLRRS